MCSRAGCGVDLRTDKAASGYLLQCVRPSLQSVPGRAAGMSVRSLHSYDRSGLQYYCPASLGDMSCNLPIFCLTLAALHTSHTPSSSSSIHGVYTGYHHQVKIASDYRNLYFGSHAVSRPRAAPPKQEEEEEQEEDLETEIARVAREMYKAFSGMNGFPRASDQVSMLRDL